MKTGHKFDFEDAQFKARLAETCKIQKGRKRVYKSFISPRSNLSHRHRKLQRSSCSRLCAATHLICESLEKRLCLTGTISVGQVVAGSISAAGETDVLTFSGNANQEILIAVADNDYNGWQQVTELRAADGKSDWNNRSGCAIRIHACNSRNLCDRHTR